MTRLNFAFTGLSLAVCLLGGCSDDDPSPQAAGGKGGASTEENPFFPKSLQRASEVLTAELGEQPNAGDIKISLAEVELLTIRIRLLVCSLDKAQEIGLDWWRYDRELSPGQQEAAVDGAALRRQIAALEDRISALDSAAATKPKGRRRR